MSTVSQSCPHHCRELWGCGCLRIWEGLPDPHHLHKPQPLDLSYVNRFNTRDICPFCLFSIPLSYFCNSTLILLWGVPTLSIGEMLAGTVNPDGLLSPGQELTKQVLKLDKPAALSLASWPRGRYHPQELIHLSGSASQECCLSVTSIFLDPQSYSGFRASKSWLFSLSFDTMMPPCLPGGNPSLAFC